MSSRQIEIRGRAIGEGHPPYIVAELSANHGGSLERALMLVEEAASAGADAVKLQTYSPDTLTIDHDGAGFRIEGGLWHGRTLYELYQEAQTPRAWHDALFRKGEEAGVTVFSSPFDPTAVDFLEELGAPAYKIASFEAIELPLIERAAATGKPLIISTGMATVTEIEEAVMAARRAGCREMVLLHCVSGYPTPPEDSNLHTIPDMAQRFNVACGLSDHTLGTSVSVAAVALGAVMIEKHLTLHRSDGGPDAAFSLEPNELQDLVSNTRAAWSALGRVSYDRADSEKPNAIFRRSLYIVRDMRRGEKLTLENVRSIRPGFGLPPKQLSAVLGRRAARDVVRGTPLDWSLID